MGVGPLLCWPTQPVGLPCREHSRSTVRPRQIKCSRSTRIRKFAAPGGKQVLDNIVMVGPGGALQNVLVYVSSTIPSDNPAWIHESYESVRNGEVIFDQKNCIFLSRLGAMWSTQTLKVLNSDPVGHNTNLDSKRGATGRIFPFPLTAVFLMCPAGHHRHHSRCRVRFIPG